MMALNQPFEYFLVKLNMIQVLTLSAWIYDHNRESDRRAEELQYLRLMENEIKN